jgi:predicted RNase H-like HicB family nuclease
MLRIDVKREDDGQWLGEIPELPGVMAYGATEAEARANTIALAFQVMGERIAHGEPVPLPVGSLLVEEDR